MKLKISQIKQQEIYWVTLSYILNEIYSENLKYQQWNDYYPKPTKISKKLLRAKHVQNDIFMEFYLCDVWEEAKSGYSKICGSTE